MDVCFIKLKNMYMEHPFSDPPLGLLYTAAAAEKVGYDVIFHDMDCDSEIPKANVYGISATTMESKQAESVALKIKKQFPDALTILGGTHATLLLNDEKSINKGFPSNFDIIFCGEGESLPSLLEQKQEPNGHLLLVKAKQVINLDSIPLPARHLLRKDLYFNTPTVLPIINKGGSNKSTTIITSRGCPYNCSFCASPRLWERKVRWRSVDNIIKEIEYLIKEYNIDTLRFQDDNMTLHRPRLQKLCLRLSDLGIWWRCSTRASLIDEEMLHCLWYGGCREIGFGIESADDNILKLINKGAKTKDNILSLSYVRDYGFRVRVFLMTGLPGENVDTSDKTIEFLEKVKPDVVTLCTFMPIPGSDIWIHPERYKGEVLVHEFEKFDFALKKEKNAPFGFKPYELTIEQMEINREKLKQYIFNRKMSNVFAYNEAYL